jgi:hypothetical protein
MRKVQQDAASGRFVQINPLDLQMLTISAVRYAIGRMTYIVGETTEFVMRAWPELGAARSTIYRDVCEAVTRADGDPTRRWLGGDCDARMWRDLRAWMAVQLGHTTEPDTQGTKKK